jgi:hypothetical protein
MIDKNVCPNCGSDDKFKRHVVHDVDVPVWRKDVYKCFKCDYMGYYNEKEWINIKRTNLIDKMLNG